MEDLVEGVGHSDDLLFRELVVSHKVDAAVRVNSLVPDSMLYLLLGHV